MDCAMVRGTVAVFAMARVLVAMTVARVEIIKTRQRVMRAVNERAC
jgi:hypothetical protein